MKIRLPWILAGVMVTAVTALLAVAQARSRLSTLPPNPSYDGRYAFARLRYPQHPGDRCTCQLSGSAGPAGWQHDYPGADRNLMQIATALTTLKARVDSGAVFAADDPALMKYPILYLTEPACWHPSDAEVTALRTYLMKGGFLIVDDFTICTGGVENYEESRRVFETQIQRVIPNSVPIPVDLSSPVLNGFFKLNPNVLRDELQARVGEVLEVHGIFEHNDPTKRMMVAANYNTAIHISWAWQTRGLHTVEKGNESYKLGVNYLMYGLTH